MEPIEIGKKIKEAYPQYANRDEEELGTSYLKKYGGAISSVKSGQLKITDIPMAQRVAISLGVSGTEEGKISPMQAIAEVMKQGGSEFVNKGNDKDARSAIAQEIMRMGGVSEYRNVLPLKDLVTEKENEGLTASTDLKAKIAASLPGFEKDVIGGTGPIAGRIFDAPIIGGLLQSLASPETREKRRNAGNIMALYQQMISGKVVSDKEVERLQTFLPSGNKSETQNREDMKRLQDRIDTNFQLFEIAKREGLTTNEAYDKYAKIQNNKLVISKPKNTNKSKTKFSIESIE